MSDNSYLNVITSIIHRPGSCTAVIHCKGTLAHLRRPAVPLGHGAIQEKSYEKDTSKHRSSGRLTWPFKQRTVGSNPGAWFFFNYQHKINSMYKFTEICMVSKRRRYRFRAYSNNVLRKEIKWYHFSIKLKLAVLKWTRAQMQGAQVW